MRILVLGLVASVLGLSVSVPVNDESSGLNWQEFLQKNLKTGSTLKEAAIVDTDGNILAKSDNFPGSDLEIQTILSKFSTREHFQQNGIVLGGVKYIYLSGTEQVMRGRKSQNGVHIMKTNKVLLIGVYEAPTIAQQAAVVVEKAGDSLRPLGF